MLTPGLTIIAQPWIRHRVGMRAVLVALAILLIASRPLIAWSGGEWWLIRLLTVAILSVISGYILNAILFLDREGDLASGYPRRLFVLPVSATTLAFWPMVLNVATVTTLWLLTVAIVPDSFTAAPPMLLPILLLAAAVSWLQAMVWCPFGASWYRLVVCLTVYITLAMPPLVAKLVFEIDFPWELLLTAYLFGAWGLAYWAVSRSRRGDVWMPRLKGGKLVNLASGAFERRRSFGSSASAQLWFEARCHLWMLPSITFWFLAVFIVFLAATPFRATQPVFSTSLLALAFASPPLMALSVSARFGRFEPFWWAGSPSIGFMGTRPMTTQSLVVAKFRNALASVLLAWGVVVVLVAVTVLGSETWLDTVELLRKAARPYEARSAWLIASLALILTPALSWKCLTSGLPFGLTGRRWVVESHAWVFAAVTMALAVPLVWLVGHREWLPTLIESIPLFIVALAPFKAIVAVVGFRKAIGRRLIDGPYTAGALAIWLAFTLCMWGLAWLVTSPFDPPFSAFWMLGAAAITSPLGRFALAPLALDWNRHR
ncbi:hypothetical protein [Paludisphaera borealis]|uniref:Uncharacterized protein n=1 Tax=Paludisphaera borealis TaxID=1387353 RepID=A0A1U7CPH6_9BACT|nr:hypothetical protein [Paludisphaera borealis]APW60783.1 hypothetical protein BSF38_02272 [Paludisphaera borealis]